MPASISPRATRNRARKPSSASVSAPSRTATPPKARSKSISKPQATTPVGKKKSIRGKLQLAQDVWCICRGPDDSTPMIRCESCKDWFHFVCINLSERDAEEIQLYVCDACHTKTGQSTVYEWEGPDAVEEFVEDGVEALRLATDANGVSTNRTAGQGGMKVEEREVAVIDEPDEEDDEPEPEASGDDYKEEERYGSVVVRRGKGTKRITSSDEEEVHNDGSNSPSPSPAPRALSRRTQLKRKRGKESQIMQRKRPRKPSSEASEVGTDDDDDQDERKGKRGNNKAKVKHDWVLDPTRKYCSGKLRDVLVPIFVQFANASQAADGQGGEEGSATELNKEQNEKAEEDGAAYVQDLEQCLFETYGEPDKRGNKTAAGKYKDRFRMLSFNLSQPDRHLLRRNIGTHALPALQLSKMSSVELANEQTKLQIEAANRESLEHSILKQRPIAARAKITHKGEEIIEDLVGDDVGRRIGEEEQREREREREREKGAREKAKMPPPPTPAPKEKLSFKGPQDILAQQHNAASQKAAQAQAQRPPLFAASSSLTELPVEPSFKFDDLIAIDLPDDSPPQESTLPDADVKPIASSASPSTDIQPEAPALPPVSELDSVVRGSRGRSASFDLNDVWSGAAPENTIHERSGSPILSRADDVRDPASIDIDLGTAADDEDFDMFLDQPEASSTTPVPSGPEAEQAAFQALPIVWSGNILLPDAGKSPAVQARQVGGRPIDFSSSQWRTLFPSQLPHQLKIDGRVPIKESAKYMTQNRMNVTRELIIVALTPSADRGDFDEIISFLVNRDRHAVVHPWGPNPGPDAPGKELYLIPIMPHEDLPEYVEILDLDKFPKRRDDKVLLGVFILNKGKFSERIPSGLLQPPAHPPISQPDTNPVKALGVPTSLTGSPTAPAPASQTAQQASATAPEIVSKLTTQQIESLLQSVLAGGMNSMPPAQPQQVPAPPTPSPFPSPFPPPIANLLSQQYPTHPYSPYPSTGMPGPPQYSPPPPRQSPPMPYSYTPPNMPTSPPRDQEHRGTPPYGNGYTRPGRVDFDRPRGGRSFSGGERGRGVHSSDFDRPRDSGWGGRGRGRGGPHRSPPRPW